MGHGRHPSFCTGFASGRNRRHPQVCRRRPAPVVETIASTLTLESLLAAKKLVSQLGSVEAAKTAVDARWRSSVSRDFPSRGMQPLVAPLVDIALLVVKRTAG